MTDFSTPSSYDEVDGTSALSDTEIDDLATDHLAEIEREDRRTKRANTRRSSGKRKTAKTSESVIREAIETYDKMRSASGSELSIMAALLGVDANALDVAVARATKSAPGDDVAKIVSISKADDIEAMIEATMLVEDKAGLRRAWGILDAATESTEDLLVSRTHTVQIAANLVHRVRSLDSATLADLTSAAEDLA